MKELLYAGTDPFRVIMFQQFPVLIYGSGLTLCMMVRYRIFVKEIISLIGRIVHSEKFNAVKDSCLFKMDVTSLDKGFYFIRTYKSSKNILRKFVKL